MEVNDNKENNLEGTEVVNPENNVKVPHVNQENNLEIPQVVNQENKIEIPKGVNQENNIEVPKLVIEDNKPDSVKATEDGKYDESEDIASSEDSQNGSDIPSVKLLQSKLCNTVPKFNEHRLVSRSVSRDQHTHTVIVCQKGNKKKSQWKRRKKKHREVKHCKADGVFRDQENNKLKRRKKKHREVKCRKVDGVCRDQENNKWKRRKSKANKLQRMKIENRRSIDQKKVRWMIRRKKVSRISDFK